MNTEPRHLRALYITGGEGAGDRPATVPASAMNTRGGHRQIQRPRAEGPRRLHRKLAAQTKEVRCEGESESEPWDAILSTFQHGGRVEGQQLTGR